MKKLCSLSATLLALGACALAARADFTHPAFTVSIAANGIASSGYACDYGSVVRVSETEWFFEGARTDLDGTLMSWAYLVDPDPFITGTFSLTNETELAREYVVDFALPISPAMSASTIMGQMAGTLTDANGSGSALMTSIGGGFVYTALADGLFVHGLMPEANQSVSSPFGTASFSGGAFGQENPLAGPAISSTIGIRFAFMLSAGDSVSFSSIFVANPVPAPGAMALGILASAFTVGRRRRW